MGLFESPARYGAVHGLTLELKAARGRENARRARDSVAWSQGNRNFIVVKCGYALEPRVGSDDDPHAAISGALDREAREHERFGLKGVVRAVKGVAEIADDLH